MFVRLDVSFGKAICIYSQKNFIPAFFATNMDSNTVMFGELDGTDPWSTFFCIADVTELFCFCLSYRLQSKELRGRSSLRPATCSKSETTLRGQIDLIFFRTQGFPTRLSKQFNNKIWIGHKNNRTTKNTYLQKFLDRSRMHGKPELWGISA